MGPGAGNNIYQSLGGPVEKYGPWRPEFGPEGRHFVSGNSLFLYFWGSSEAARGAQRPFWYGKKTNKTGARSARARTRGQNPLVIIEENKQKLKRREEKEETEGLDSEREGFKMER